MKLLYRFSFPDGTSKEFPIELDSDTLALVSNGNEAPEWTRLDFHQCSNCPLKTDQSPHCPVAKNLVGVISFFKEALSYQEAEIEIISESRTYKKKTPLQAAIGSLIGVFMVTSGCPILDKLRPMVRSHLPFATAEETVYRAMSMYLTAQYFVQKKGKKPDWDLKGLVKVYEEIRTVNKCFVKRLNESEIADASLNAVVILDCFADMATMSIQENQFGALEKLFEPYTQEGPSPKL